MIFISSDHAGYKLKGHLVKYIKNHLKMDIMDMGPDRYVETDDFTDYVKSLTDEVLLKETNIGILICGSGQGMCIAANRVRGIRAALAYSIESAESARKEDNVNVLCLAGRVLSNEHAESIVKKFLETKFEDIERRVRRVKKIDEIVK